MNLRVSRIVSMLITACSVACVSEVKEEGNYMVNDERSIEGARHIMQMIKSKTGTEDISHDRMHLYQEYLKLAKQPGITSRTSDDIDWIERGPGNVGGRTRTLVVDNSDSTDATWIVGAAGGGIWKTQDAGRSWYKVTPDAPNLSCVTIAQSASNPMIMYAGTGEGALGGNYMNGYGILKSLDAGESWEVLESTSILNSDQFLNTNRIIVHPENENIVLAATSNGLNGQDFLGNVMKSTDGGASWSVLYAATSRPQQLMADPDDFNTLYVSLILNGMAKSTDGGNTWTITTLRDIVQAVGGSIERTEFAVAPTNSSRIYASVSYESRSGSGLFMSNDKGESWIQVSAQTGASDDYLEQGEYDNCITVHPFNDNIVFWGGVNLWSAELIQSSIIEGERNFIGVDEENTSNFLSFVNFNNGTHFNNSFLINDPTSVPTIEIRFGTGRSQKAHRFTVPAGSTSGVPTNDYSYQDYVDIPFEAWDIENNRQLMVSFRDQQNNGVFNLNPPADDQSEANNREYLYLHDEEYSGDTPSAAIAVSGGQEVNQYIFIWPTLTEGATWDAENLPESILRINFGNTRFQNSSIQELPGNNSVHVDHHYLTTIVKSDNEFDLITTNDGGVGLSSDAGQSFIELERRLNTSQFYAATKRPGESIYIGGTQDNDVLLSAGSDPNALSFYEEQYSLAFADGFDVIWNPVNNEEILASNQNNFVFKSTDGGQNWMTSTDGLDDSGFSNADAPFFTKFGYSPRQSNRVFAISISGVWRSLNFGSSWELVNLNVNQGWGGFLDVEVSDVDPNIVWAGGAMDENRNIYVSVDGGLNFNPVSKADRPEDLGNITTIVPDPLNANGAYLLFSQYESRKILKTTDLGQTWTEISGFGENSESSNGFPNVGAFSLLAFPDGNQIWVGTEIGLLESLDAGESWNFADNGIPNVLIWDMRVRDGEIVAATHGRGIWTVDLELEYDFPEITSIENIEVESKLFTLYPNPVSDVITISAFGFNEVNKVEVISSSGVKVLELHPHHQKINSYRVDLTDIRTGKYIMRLFDSNSIYQYNIVKL